MHLFFLLLCVSLKSFAGLYNTPAGVMGDHIHKKGEFMGMYSGMYSKMDGVYGMSEAESLAKYGQSPQAMVMRMYMAMAMYGITDKFNIMAMGHFMDMDMTSSMKMEMMPKHTHSHESSGVGDVEITGLYSIFKDDKQRLQANLGLIFPTGSVNKRHTMMDQEGRMSYMMQMGSGSYSLHPQFSWGLLQNKYEFGVQTGAIVRFNKNTYDYKFGNVYNLTTWAVRKVGKFAFTSRLNYTQTGDISGRDSELDPSQIAMNDPKLQYRKQLDFLLGTNYNITHRVKVLFEVGVPLCQKTGNGMMKNDYTVNISLQHSL